jgi:AcrR family transcriptional regulator
MTSAKDKAENTKKLIAEKAREVFSQKGYFLASMEMIRIHSGMSKGSIYYHFKSKSDLFMYLLEVYTQEWIDKWEEKAAKLDTAKEKLYALAVHFAMDFESPLMQAATEFSGSESADPKIIEQLYELNGRYFPVVQKVIEEGVGNGEFKQINLEEITIITYGYLASVGAICKIIDYPDMNKIYKMAVDVLLDGLKK